MKVSRYGKPVVWKETDFKDITLPKPRANEIKEKIKAYYIGDDIDKLLDYITNLQNLLKIRTDCLKMNQDRIDKASDMLVCAYGGNEDYYMERIKRAQKILKGEDK